MRLHLVRSDVLTFGDFTTKSGRQTPFFINTGRYRTGEQLARLGEFYAAAVDEAWPDGVDILFGPAYKGIPLVATTSIGLAARGRDVGYLFNRKEAKDHGEGGVLVGALPQDGDRVLIVEDVTTAGTSIRETVPVLQAHADVEVVGLIVSADRQERGTGDLSALAQVAQDFDMTTRAIVTLDEIVEHLHGREVDGTVVVDDAMLGRINAYRAEYGA
ncbi:MAG: orotate phosphoribosyltransferase [Planctomycetota bacterium]